MTRHILKRIFESAAFSDAEKMTDELFAKYHDLDGVFCADTYTLEQMIGKRAAMLVKLSAALSSRRVTDELKPGCVCDPITVREYIIALFRGCSTEMVYVISFDLTGRLLSVDLVGEGTVNSANVSQRRLVDVAVKNRAAGVVIAHNHPGGRATPSRQDMNFTTSVREMLSSAGIELIAHYAVAASNCIKV